MKALTACFLITFCIFQKSENENWQQDFNNDLTALKSNYVTNPQFFKNEKLNYNFDDYLQNLKDNWKAVKSIKSLFKIEASKTISYEIGSFKTTTNDEIFHIIIWNNSTGKEKRELEYFENKSNVEKDSTGLNSARNKWIKLCNQHLPNALIEQCYTPNANYYNHRPMVIGTKLISSEYSYMKNPNYKLNLKPLHIEYINSSTIFEIGQCEGSYQGKYLLVWKKEKDWKVFLDANI
ncbi:hypothetical protein EGI22_03350 [Lacihabitans sp. LS3-19]|uniref:hypothetical protein n=1 Tax=Lacihabitans sp. LS3-19 TaxID=2487335 RepID=UPI0020CBBBD4|nr:hypothetical protein [Lacihabitans sp. LS3-19]MCP9766930.1 hypothetical protein [Lacihabitans sp. LS3-19]